MQHLYDAVYYDILNITSIYDGVHYTKLKKQIVDIFSKDSCLNRCEWCDVFDDILMELCMWGILSWNHGYLFHCEYIPCGTDLHEYIMDKEQSWIQVYYDPDLYFK